MACMCQVSPSSPTPILPKNAVLSLVAEGAANVLYRISIPKDTPVRYQDQFYPLPWHPFEDNPFEGKLLRLRKETSDGIDTLFTHEKYLRWTHNIFPVENVVHQRLVYLALPDNWIPKLNGHLEQSETNQPPPGYPVRPEKRRKHYLRSDLFGLLVTDMTASEGRLTVEFKPKWLCQSMSAVKHLKMPKRCRNCARRAQMVQDSISKGQAWSSSAPDFCPMGITRKDTVVIRNVVRRILASQKLEGLNFDIKANLSARERGLISAMTQEFAANGFGSEADTPGRGAQVTRKLVEMQLKLDLFGIMSSGSPRYKPKKRTVKPVAKQCDHVKESGTDMEPPAIPVAKMYDVVKEPVADMKPPFIIPVAKMYETKPMADIKLPAIPVAKMYETKPVAEMEPPVIPVAKMYETEPAADMEPVVKPMAKQCDPAKEFAADMKNLLRAAKPTSEHDEPFVFHLDTVRENVSLAMTLRDVTIYVRLRDGATDMGDPEIRVGDLDYKNPRTKGLYWYQTEKRLLMEKWYSGRRIDFTAAGGSLNVDPLGNRLPFPGEPGSCEWYLSVMELLDWRVRQAKMFLPGPNPRPGMNGDKDWAVPYGTEGFNGAVPYWAAGFEGLVHTEIGKDFSGRPRGLKRNKPSEEETVPADEMKGIERQGAAKGRVAPANEKEYLEREEAKQLNHIQSLISQVKDMFPDLGVGFILELLDNYDNNIEEAIANLIEGTLPPRLRDADRSDTGGPSAVAPAAPAVAPADKMEGTADKMEGTDTMEGIESERVSAEGHMQSMISRVQKFFPDFGADFVRILLNDAEGDVQQVISNLFDAWVPPHLDAADHTDTGIIAPTAEPADKMEGIESEGVNTEVQLQSMISQVQEIFPHFGSGFISKLLAEYNNEVEQVVFNLLEGLLPPHLAELDHDTGRVAPAAETKDKGIESKEASRGSVAFADEPADKMEEIESKYRDSIHRIDLICQVKDMFPDVGSGFAGELLDEYNNDLGEIAKNVLLGTLPPHLRDADRGAEETVTPTDKVIENEWVQKMKRRTNMISQVKDMFPHLGTGFIGQLLNAYNNDIEKLAEGVLMDSIPPYLRNADHTAGGSSLPLSLRKPDYKAGGSSLPLSLRKPDHKAGRTVTPIVDEMEGIESGGAARGRTATAYEKEGPRIGSSINRTSSSPLPPGLMNQGPYSTKNPINLMAKKKPDIELEPDIKLEQDITLSKRGGALGSDPQEYEKAVACSSVLEAEDTISESTDSERQAKVLLRPSLVYTESEPQDEAVESELESTNTSSSEGETQGAAPKSTESKQQAKAVESETEFTETEKPGRETQDAAPRSTESEQPAKAAESETESTEPEKPAKSGPISELETILIALIDLERNCLDCFENPEFVELLERLEEIMNACVANAMITEEVDASGLMADEGAVDDGGVVDAKDDVDDKGAAEIKDVADDKDAVDTKVAVDDKGAVDTEVAVDDKGAGDAKDDMEDKGALSFIHTMVVLGGKGDVDKESAVDKKDDE